MVGQVIVLMIGDFFMKMNIDDKIEYLYEKDYKAHNEMLATFL
jgi:hypothetical protein